LGKSVVEVVTVSAYTAGWAMEAAKPPARTPASVAAREARLREVRQARDGDADEDDVESLVPTIQSTAVALDLLTEGDRQPRSSIQQVIDAYSENG
jgi:hypothetical protein